MRHRINAGLTKQILSAQSYVRRRYVHARERVSTAAYGLGWRLTHARKRPRHPALG